jgi:hypothetical protein
LVYVLVFLLFCPGSVSSGQVFIKKILVVSMVVNLVGMFMEDKQGSLISKSAEIIPPPDTTHVLHPGNLLIFHKISAP